MPETCADRLVRCKFRFDLQISEVSTLSPFSKIRGGTPSPLRNHAGVFLKSERALQQRPAPRPSASALLSVAPRLELSAMVMQIIHLSFLAATSRPRPSVIENPFLGSVCPQTTKSRATPEAEVPRGVAAGIEARNFPLHPCLFLSPI
jgi:hypothetical protein